MTSSPVVRRPSPPAAHTLRTVLRRQPPGIRRRLLEAVSVAICLTTQLATALGRLLLRTVLRVSQALLRWRDVMTGVTGERARTRPQRRRGPLSLLAGTLFTVMVVLAVATGPVLRLAALPLAHTVAKGLPPLEQGSAILGTDGTRLAVVQEGLNRRALPLDQIPPVVRDAVIAAEDESFWTHGGYDAKALTRALIANVRAGEVTQGGSTITQQVAKQNFAGSRESIVRKVKELLYAVALENRLTKEQILERYLNQVYFGSQAYGVAAAAEEFFGVEVADLSAPQAALLAGVIRAPVALDPRKNPAGATTRRNQVLAAMASAGSIPRATAEASAAQPLRVLPARAPVRSDPFVVEAVKREFLANPAFGDTEADRRRLLLTGGLEIRTTIDAHLQDAARRALEGVPEDLGGALVAVDPRSGAIRAIHDGGEAEHNQFDVATQGRRAPGSTFKPLAAAAALEAGMPQNQFLVGDGPIELDYVGPSGPWRVDNFDHEQFGPVVLADAVAHSVNTAFAQIGVAVGPERIADVADRLGVDVDRAMGPPEKRGPALALGGLENGVSPLELASAYAAFAAGGSYSPPYLIDRVVRPDGRELYAAKPSSHPVLDPAANAILVGMLQQAVAEGTGTAAAIPGWEPLGKTGTSEQEADAWFVGATPVLAAAVWVGHPGSTEPVDGLTGGSVAAPLWADFMTAALDGVEPVPFPMPASAERQSTAPLDLPVAHAAAPDPDDDE